MIGEQVHPITGVTQSVKGRGSNAGNLVYRDMLDEDGRVIGVRVDSNDDSGFWLEVLFPKTSQTKDTVMKEDGDDDEDDDEKDNNEDDDEKDDDEKDDDEDGDVGAKTISKLRLLGEKHGVKMTSKDA